MANAQLDLACQVGSKDAIIEAIEDGADINHGGGSPLILAIMANDRPTVAALVELGADVSQFEVKVTDQDAIIDELMKGAPNTEAVPEEDPVDAKLVRAFDRMIRNKGLGEPLRRSAVPSIPISSMVSNGSRPKIATPSSKISSNSWNPPKPNRAMSAWMPG